MVSYTVIGYVNTLVLMVMSGIAQGIQPISSFYYGKQERKSYETILKMALAMAIILSVGSFLGCQMFGGSIVGLFIKRDSLLFDSSVAALRKYSLAFVLMGFNVVLAAFFTSIEKASRSFPISVGRGLIFPVLALVLVPKVLGAENLWYAGAVSEVAASVIAGNLWQCIYKTKMKILLNLLICGKALAICHFPGIILLRKDSQL